MKKFGFMIMLMGIMTFAFTGCSSGGTANNLGGMIDRGMEDVKEGVDDMLGTSENGLMDGTTNSQKGIYRDNAYSAGIKNGYMYSSSDYVGNNAYNGRAYGGGYANIGK